MPTSVVTGANRGIGLEICRQLAARGDNVIALCRTSSPELDKTGARIEAGVDVADAASTHGLRDRLKDVAIDLLINNAGVLDRGGAGDFDSIERQFEINALGPLRVIDALLPRMRDGGKIALVTSRMGSIADNSSGGYYGYRMSKAALNAAGVSLAHDLRSRNIAVVLLHPGMVATDMTGRHGIPPADAARGLIARIDALTPAASGSFLHAGTGEVLPW